MKDRHIGIWVKYDLQLRIFISIKVLHIYEPGEWSGHIHLSQKVYLILILLKDYLTRSAFQAINKAKWTKQQLLRKLMCPMYTS